MKLEPEFSYAAELAEPQIVSPGPYGLRQILAVTRGRVTGNRFSGTAFGDPRYAWGNQSISIGQGRMQPGPVEEFQVLRVVL